MGLGRAWVSLGRVFGWLRLARFRVGLVLVLGVLRVGFRWVCGGFRVGFG